MHALASPAFAAAAVARAIPILGVRENRERFMAHPEAIRI